jgi:deazaflavin-dependent oxidoreductase (nitroreductase family)
MKLGMHVAMTNWAGGAARLGPTLVEAVEAAEAAGFDAISVADHVWLHPMVGGPEASQIEAYTTLGFVAARVPPRLSFFNLIAKFLLAAGVPMGFNGLITIRGRKSSVPRTTPVAIIEVSGRRWVSAPLGEVQWVRNLRATGRATIIERRRKEEVRATELDPTQRVAFFRDILGPLARHPVRCLVHSQRR